MPKQPIRFKVRGSTEKLEKFLKSVQEIDIPSIVAEQAQIGVNALSDVTPQYSGLAASSWDYVISQNGGGISIEWLNYDVENGFPVVIMLQYGHGTGTGGYVHGRDFINPTIQPIFDQIADTVWKAVTSA